MFGLLVGYILTWPVVWLINWKQGVGGAKVGKKHQGRSYGARYGLWATTAVLGIATLVFPAWLVKQELVAERMAGTASIASVASVESSAVAMASEPPRFAEATVLNARGAKVGEATGIPPDAVEVAFSGAWDVWGFLDLTEEHSTAERQLR